MSTVETVEPRIQNVKVTSEAIIAYLVDGRVVSVPLVWSWRLSEATARQRRRFVLIGDGQGVHWPDIDEDISVEGMLHGVPAHRHQESIRSESPRANGRRTPSSRRRKRSGHVR